MLINSLIDILFNYDVSTVLFCNVFYILLVMYRRNVMKYKKITFSGGIQEIIYVEAVLFGLGIEARGEIRNKYDFLHVAI